MFTQSQFISALDAMRDAARSDVSRSIGGAKIVYSVLQDDGKRQSIDIWHFNADTIEKHGKADIDKVMARVAKESPGHLLVLIECAHDERVAWRAVTDRLMHDPEGLLCEATLAAEITGHTLAALAFSVSCDGGGVEPVHDHSAVLWFNKDVIEYDLDGLSGLA